MKIHNDTYKLTHFIKFPVSVKRIGLNLFYAGAREEQVHHTYLGKMKQLSLL